MHSHNLFLNQAGKLGNVRRFLTLGWFVFCLVVIALWALLPLPPALVDTVYTRGLYRGIAAVLVPVTGATALPVLPILVAVLLVWLIVGTAWRRRRPFRPRGWQAFLHGFYGLLIGVVTIWALFILLWGENYARTPLETHLQLSTDTEPSMLDIISLTESLGNIIRQTETSTPDWDADLEAAQASLRRVTDSLERRPVTLPRFVKRTPPGVLLYTGRATGITSPWTLEAYVDSALPYPIQLATALHENAHIAGYTGEAEADFVTGLAGLTAENASVRYSTALSLFQRSLQNLTPERTGPTYEDLPARAKRDLEALRQAYTRYAPPPAITAAERRIYDSYLKTQGVGAGVADYDRVSVLLMAAQRDGIIEFDWEETLLHPPE